jgi:CheY-like chemotaxis protein
MHSILLVDDDPDILVAWGVILVDEGYEVRFARNGVEALDAVKLGRPDVIVTDWMMPLMDGAELCRRLKAQPDLANVPILVHSAAPPPTDGSQVWTAWLPKPVNARLFLTTVAQLCKHSS